MIREQAQIQPLSRLLLPIVVAFISAVFSSPSPAVALAFTDDAQFTLGPACSVAGGGACGSFAQTFIGIQNVAPTGSVAILNTGGFRFTSTVNNVFGTLSFSPDAASVGKAVTISMNGKRHVKWDANETLQLLSSLDMVVSDPGGLAVSFQMQTNFSLGVTQGFAAVSNGSVMGSQNVSLGVTKGKAVKMDTAGEADLLGFFTAGFTPMQNNATNNVTFSFANSADALIESTPEIVTPEPATGVLSVTALIIMGAAYLHRRRKGAAA